MKTFLRGIITIFITILLIGLGVIISLKGMLIDTTDSIVKQELTNNIVDVIETTTDEKLSEEVKNKVEDTITNNKEITKIIDTSWDKIIEILSDENAEITIDVNKELSSIIDDGEKILNDHGITITESDKEELLSTVSSEEINNVVNEMASEIRSDMTSETKMVLDIYNFLTSSTLKIAIIAVVIVGLLLIALLKKSYYGWLSNFATASIISGGVVGIIFKFLINSIFASLEAESNITISTSSLSTYGYTLIILGIIAIIINIVLSKIFTKPQTETEK